MFCENCGKQMGNSKFCPHCGAKAYKETPQTQYVPNAPLYSNEKKPKKTQGCLIAIAVIIFFGNNNTRN